jgi:hypothetical protein
LLSFPKGMRLYSLLERRADRNWLPLADPVWLTADEAHHMRPDDPAVGVLARERPYAFPWWILRHHHVANVTLDGEPVLVALCRRSSSQAAFDPRLDDGRRLTFQLIGSYRGTIAIADYETVSIWAPFLGVCLFGALEGRRLRPVPAVLSAWCDWVELFPGTYVLDGQGELRDRAEEILPGAHDAPVGKLKESDLDDRLPPNELVLGVEAGGSGRAYPLGALAKVGGAVNDTLGGADIVVLSLPGRWPALAFERSVDGQVLAFERLPDGRIVDSETRSVWHLSGEALAGPLAGTRLRFVPSHTEEWYVWAAYHPETGIFGGA